MATTIKIKHSTTAGNAPSSLAQGELAINVADGNLFYGDGSGVSQDFAVNTLTAQQYIVSSSVTYMTQSFSSGSTAFGDSTDDTHVFTGGVTATEITSSTFNIGNGGSFSINLTNPTQDQLLITRANNGATIGQFDAGSVTGGKLTIGQLVANDSIDLNGKLDIDYSTTNTNTAVVDISNGTSTIMSTDHYTLKVAGGQANGAPSGQQKSYGGYFTAGNTNGALPDSIALYAQGHEDGAPNSYAAIFSGSAGGVVGINTMEPTVELDVVGDISASNNVVANAFYGDGSNLSGVSTATGVENNADVTDTTNVTAAGALMDSEVTNLAQVKAFDSSDYATAAQGAKADTAIQPAGTASFAITGSDVSFGSITATGANFSDGNITNVGQIDVDNVSDDATGGDTNISLTGTTLDIDVGATGIMSATATSIDFNTAITASADISSSGDIFCNNITVAEDITSVGDDIILKDNLAVSSSGGSIQFRGTAGGSNESITYLDSGGTGRFAMLFPGSDVVAITNRASNGTVEIRANSSTAGSGGEVTVAEFQDDLINLNVAQRRLLEVSTTTDGNGNGDYIKLGSTATTAGKIYYYNSSGNWVLTDADAASSSTGLIAVAMSNNSSKGMLLKGCVTLATDPGTVGDVLYLQTDTAGNTGDATSTAPSGTGDVVRVIGYCLNSTNGQIYFDPSKDHIVHA